MNIHQQRVFSIKLEASDLTATQAETAAVALFPV